MVASSSATISFVASQNINEDSEKLATVSFLVVMKRQKERFSSLIRCFVLTPLPLFSHSLAHLTI